MRKYLIVAIVLVLAFLAGTLIARADDCYGTVTGKYHFYNRYTLSLHGNHYDAHLYGGWVAGVRAVNWCNSRLGYSNGNPRLFYPLVGSNLWASKSEVNVKK